ncbi:MAG: DNA gyrase subunit B, partial [Desulfobacteraceae bacterium]|nr:DNA gyrase subunit B [Desulfobacteraceae bacterium]
IQKGYLYIAQPPLFRVGKGKSGTYLKNEKEYSEYLIKRICEQKNLFINNSNNKYNNEDLYFFLNKLIDYDGAIERLKKREYDINLLTILINQGVKDKYFLIEKENLQSLKSIIKENGYKTKEVEYDAEREIYTLEVLDEREEKVLLKIGKSILSSNDYQIMLKRYENIKSYDKPPFLVSSKNDNKDKAISFSNIKEFYNYMMKEAKKGMTIQRYKGLGEMNADQLWETTMIPEKRKLLQVKTEDMETSDEIFTLLMGEEVEPRRNFIQTHALEVSSLDY